MNDSKQEPVVGFTGTRKGLTPAQTDRLRQSLAERTPGEAHHGDCVGADAVFHDLCLEAEIPVVLHPPDNAKHRAYCGGSLREEAEQSYQVRNRAIVDASDEMLAATDSDKEKARSGTWATIRYARKQGKPIRIVYPDGRASDDPIPFVPEFFTRDSSAGTARPDHSGARSSVARSLPFVGQLTAGSGLFDGLSVDNLEHAFDWISVPPEVIGRNRFVVEIVGNSMAPAVDKGDYVVCEYHRSARRDGQIVIYASRDGDGFNELALKRIKLGSKGLEFHSDNPVYDPIIPINQDADGETSHQLLLGVAVYNLTKAHPIR